MEPDWLVWARQIQALAQSGLTYTENPYDRQRYEALRALAAEMVAARSGADVELIQGLFEEQNGYATPKVDVRGAVFDPQGRVLLVRELADKGRWTLPGGWADVNQSPAECVAREVLEEASLPVRVLKLACCYDQARHLHPPSLFHIYKLFFICEPLGDASLVRHDGLETGEARFFTQSEIPEDDALSRGRVTWAQLQRLFRHREQPELPTDFD